MKSYVMGLSLLATGLIAGERLSAAEPPHPIIATKEEMPDAIKTLASRDLTEEDRQHYRVSYKTAVVAEQIRAEVKSKKCEPWEGVFSCSKGVDSDDELCVRAGRYSLIGTHYRDTGVYVKKGDLLTLTSDMPGHEFAEKLLIVPWAQRVYLVQPDRMISFCNCVNSGWTPDFCLHNQGSDKIPPGELPRVPTDKRKFLLRVEVRAKVKKIGEIETAKDVPGRYRELTGRALEIDRGSRDGLTPGIELTAWTDDFFAEALVVESHENRAKLLIEPMGPDYDKGLKVGMVFSSRLPDALLHPGQDVKQGAKGQADTKGQ